MAAKLKEAPLIVIVGPTGSGKSAIAMEIARRFNGEIVCADSRTVYKGMDIGTAKPSAAEQAEIPHHLLDIIEPNQPFTAAQFKKLATEAIADIYNRHKLPILAGGTGLYIDAVIFDYAFLPPAPPEDREQLQQLSVQELQDKIFKLGLPLPENSQNPRHLMRVIETNGAVAVKRGLRNNTLVIGVEIGREDLIERLKLRITQMLRAGLETEARQLAGRFGWQAPGLSGVGYREWSNQLSPPETADLIFKDSYQYARRQRTWFRRNSHIHWIKNAVEAQNLVKYFLQQK